MRPSGLGHSQSTAIESRVMPASGPVIIRSSPSMRLTSVDLPAFGRPTMASLSDGVGVVLVLLFLLDILAVDMGEQRLEQVAHALAMLGRKRDRIAEAEAEALEHAGLAGAAFGLVGDEDDRRVGAAQPAAPPPRRAG